MLDIKKIVAKCVCGADNTLDTAEVYGMLEYPPDPNMGDIALPCFKLSKKLKKAPVVIAQQLLGSLESCEYIKKAEAVAGYLNFFLDTKRFIGEVLSVILSCGSDYGKSGLGEGKTVVIDFSAPNIAKPFHVGHLRSTAIGNSLYRIHKFMGYKAIGINHLGDWGTQFGKLIVAYKKWGNRLEVQNGGVKALMALYVKFHEESEKDTSLEDEAREWFIRMEKRDEEALFLWQWIKDISLDEFKKVYDLMGVHFDSWAGESFYNDKSLDVVLELKDKQLLKESEGAHLVELEQFSLSPCMILKKDGGTLYATRDIAAAIYRKKTYDFESCIYVTSAGQSLHFAQWFKVVELMGYAWAKDLKHVPFGTVDLGGEKLSTRKGNVVLLEEIFDEAIKKTEEIIASKSGDLEDEEETARSIGVGAVIFSDLFSNRIKDVSFSWEEILDFDGETGPYVQYTHARACSVLRKSGMEDSISVDSLMLDNSEEYDVAKCLYEFPSKLEQALEMLEPSVITRYLVELARVFNRFYHNHSILSADEQLKKSRLALVKAVRIVLSNGLWLIGLKAPERV
jgi:arginyl-tRNA synthetase